MRTTIRIDDDLLSQLKARAAGEKTSLTLLVNRVIRAGLVSADRGADEPAHVETTFAMGEPRFDLTKASAVAAMLEDEETARELALGK